MSRADVDRMKGVLQVRVQRTASAQRALQAARRAVTHSERVRDDAQTMLVNSRQARDAEVEEIKRGLMTVGRRGSELNGALLYVKQLESKTRAAEVNFNRYDGELARARQQAEIARYEAADMQVREEKARHMLELSESDWARREQAAEQTRLESSHQALAAVQGLRFDSSSL